MIKLTPSYIIAASFLILTISCSGGFFLALVLAAFQVFPPSVAISLLRDCVVAGCALGAVAARRLRR